MSKNITDIANWEKEYPFLDAVWKFYNKFDIITVEDTYDHYIHPSCFMILNKNGMNIGAYNSFCTKLLKNLGHYSENTKSYIRSHDHCNILYNWIYNSKKKYTIPDEIINDCFEEYTRIGNAMSYDYKCSYDTYNGLYEEPIKITLLDIFDNNTPIIKTALMNPDEKISTSSRKYVCECVKIYKQMNDKYCLKREEGNEKHTNTCSRLERFKLTYTWFIQDIQDIKDKIPSLDDIKNTYMPKCQKYVQEEPLQPLGDEEQRTHSLLSKPKYKNTPGTKSLIQPDDENQDGFMSPTVSTAISTVAGASSFLALLYKFTPAKKLIHSGLGGSRGRMHSNFNVDRERELLFDGLAHDNLNSYNIGYEAAYGP